MSFPVGYEDAVDLGPMHVYLINGKYYVRQYHMVDQIKETMVISPVHASKVETSIIVQAEQKSEVLFDLNYLIKQCLISCILCHSPVCNGGQVNCSAMKNILVNLKINNRCYYCFGPRGAGSDECNEHNTCFNEMNKEPCYKLFCPKCFFVCPDKAHIKKCRAVNNNVTIRVRTALNVGFHLMHKGNSNMDRMAHADILKQRIGHQENENCFCVENLKIVTQDKSNESAKCFLDYLL